MSGNSLFLDTNIVLYLLNGDRTLKQHLLGKRLFVSFISELECLGYSGLTAKESKAIERFLSECQLIDINRQIKAEVIRLRRTTTLKLPDCIIAASASHLGLTLFTADRDFNMAVDMNIVLYNPK
jgi:hypothetical protein